MVELSAPEKLRAALALSVEATEELEKLLQKAAYSAYAEWFAKWQIVPDNVFLKGEYLGQPDDPSKASRWEANVRLKWELA